jgi:hypothetical protein
MRVEKPTKRAMYQGQAIRVKAELQNIDAAIQRGGYLHALVPLPGKLGFAPAFDRKDILLKQLREHGNRPTGGLGVLDNDAEVIAARTPGDLSNREARELRNVRAAIALGGPKTIVPLPGKLGFTLAAERLAALERPLSAPCVSDEAAVTAAFFGFGGYSMR